jgi:elongation factor G
MPNRPISKPRVAALVGPYLSGKTTLLESLLAACGVVHRKGSAKDGNMVGDSSPEAKARQMSVEVNVARAEFMGDPWTFLDCPGSVELAQETLNALAVADVAVVVCEAEPSRAITLAPLLKFLDDHEVPHILFINKMDNSILKIRDALEALQLVSERPLVLRELPIREGDRVTGYVDLVSERAYRYKPDQPSDLITIPKAVADREHEARQEMLEHLADFDDHLLEELLSDVNPPKAEIYDTLAKDLKGDLIVPVFFGSGLHDNGVHRLMKALRHEAPEPAETAARLKLPAGVSPLAQCFKTLHAAHTGKLSLVRVWQGEVSDGGMLAGGRVSGLFSLMGSKQEKKSKAIEGEVVALGRLEGVATGQLLTAQASQPYSWTAPLPPLFALAIGAAKKADEVKLSGALAKLAEEDPSYHVEHAEGTGETLLWGQGEIHLAIAAERLKNHFGVDLVTHRPMVPYKETIRKGAKVHGRHKRQSGGHGQFGDVHIDIQPLPRGSGFVFKDTISGGVVPKQYIPSVGEGAAEYLRQGPLGFQVVDLQVTLTDGTYHAVDSSDMAFKTAGRIAMSEGMPQCEPVLLEPILHVEVAVPNEFTSRAQRLLSSRRGQILGFDQKPGWKGWDMVAAYLPQSEMHDMIIELRSLTMGIGTFAWKFDHLQELLGKPAESVAKARREQLEKA